MVQEPLEGQYEFVSSTVCLEKYQNIIVEASSERGFALTKNPITNSLLFVFNINEDQKISVFDFENFFSTYTYDDVPSFTIDGKIISGKSFFAMFAPELIPEFEKLSFDPEQKIKQEDYPETIHFINNRNQKYVKAAVSLDIIDKKRQESGLPVMTYQETLEKIEEIKKKNPPKISYNLITAVVASPIHEDEQLSIEVYTNLYFHEMHAYLTVNGEPYNVKLNSNGFGRLIIEYYNLENISSESSEISIAFNTFSYFVRETTKQLQRHEKISVSILNKDTENFVSFEDGGEDPEDCSRYIYAKISNPLKDSDDFFPPFIRCRINGRACPTEFIPCETKNIGVGKIKIAPQHESCYQIQDVLHIEGFSILHKSYRNIVFRPVDFSFPISPVPTYATITAKDISSIDQYCTFFVELSNPPYIIDGKAVDTSVLVTVNGTEYSVPIGADGKNREPLRVPNSNLDPSFPPASEMKAIVTGITGGNFCEFVAGDSATVHVEDKVPPVFFKSEYVPLNNNSFIASLSLNNLNGQQGMIAHVLVDGVMRNVPFNKKGYAPLFIKKEADDKFSFHLQYLSIEGENIEGFVPTEENFIIPSKTNATETINSQKQTTEVSIAKEEKNLSFEYNKNDDSFNDDILSFVIVNGENNSCVNNFQNTTNEIENSSEVSSAVATENNDETSMYKDTVETIAVSNVENSRDEKCSCVKFSNDSLDTVVVSENSIEDLLCAKTTELSDGEENSHNKFPEAILNTVDDSENSGKDFLRAETTELSDDEKKSHNEFPDASQNTVLVTDNSGEGLLHAETTESSDGEENSHVRFADASQNIVVVIENSEENFLCAEKTEFSDDEENPHNEFPDASLNTVNVSENSGEDLLHTKTTESFDDEENSSKKFPDSSLKRVVVTENSREDILHAETAESFDGEENSRVGFADASQNAVIVTDNSGEGLLRAESAESFDREKISNITFSDASQNRVDVAEISGEVISCAETAESPDDEKNSRVGFADASQNTVVVTENSGEDLLCAETADSEENSRVRFADASQNAVLVTDNSGEGLLHAETTKLSDDKENSRVGFANFSQDIVVVTEKSGEDLLRAETAELFDDGKISNAEFLNASQNTVDVAEISGEVISCAKTAESPDDEKNPRVGFADASQNTVVVTENSGEDLLCAETAESSDGEENSRVEFVDFSQDTVVVTENSGEDLLRAETAESFDGEENSRVGFADFSQDTVVVTENSGEDILPAELSDDEENSRVRFADFSQDTVVVTENSGEDILRAETVDLSGNERISTVKILATSKNTIDVAENSGEDFLSEETADLFDDEENLHEGFSDTFQDSVDESENFGKDLSDLHVKTTDTENTIFDLGLTNKKISDCPQDIFKVVTLSDENDSSAKHTTVEKFNTITVSNPNTEILCKNTIQITVKVPGVSDRDLANPSFVVTDREDATSVVSIFKSDSDADVQTKVNENTKPQIDVTFALDYATDTQLVFSVVSSTTPETILRVDISNDADNVSYSKYEVALDATGHGTIIIDKPESFYLAETSVHFHPVSLGSQNFEMADGILTAITKQLPVTAEISAENAGTDIFYTITLSEEPLEMTTVTFTVNGSEYSYPFEGKVGTFVVPNTNCENFDSLQSTARVIEISGGGFVCPQPTKYTATTDAEDLDGMTFAFDFANDSQLVFSVVPSSDSIAEDVDTFDEKDGEPVSLSALFTVPKIITAEDNSDKNNSINWQLPNQIFESQEYQAATFLIPYNIPNKNTINAKKIDFVPQTNPILKNTKKLLIFDNSNTFQLPLFQKPQTITARIVTDRTIYSNYKIPIHAINYSTEQLFPLPRGSPFY